MVEQADDSTDVRSAQKDANATDLTPSTMPEPQLVKAWQWRRPQLLTAWQQLKPKPGQSGSNCLLNTPRINWKTVPEAVPQMLS